MANGSKGTAVARVFLLRSNRIASAWRQLRNSRRPHGAGPDNLLDDVIESFIIEVGHALEGELGSPWARTRGVLRLAPARGVRMLHDEFAALRRCMTDALEALESPERDRRIVDGAVDEALDCSVALCIGMTELVAEPPITPFGGLVVEVYEHPSSEQPRPQDDTQHAPSAFH